MRNPEQAKRELNDILEQQEYQVYYNENSSLLAMLKDRVGEWITNLIERLFPNLHVSNQAIDFVIYGLGIIGIGLLVFLIFLIKKNLTNDTSIRGRKPLKNSSELEWSYEAHLQEAERHNENSFYTQATRHVFLAMLLYFDEQGLVDARAWKTNWDYYEELRHVNDMLANQFQSLARTFDEATYGERTMNAEEFGYYRQKAMKWLEGNEGSG